MSEVKVNKISPRTNCGTVQLGDSGDTITIPAGATITNNGTQTGFGRTGTVDWQTTKKTASFTAVSGEGYFVDTSSSAITATLPASPSAGDIVYIKDYDGSFGTNNCTVARNSSNIRGGTSDFILAQDNAGAVFIYVDATEGWQVFADGSDADVQETFITATGGTITTSGDCKIHTFTGPGTFAVTELAGSAANNRVSYLVVAGGGGAGECRAGGGGAGGFREDKSPVTPYTASPLNGAGAITVAEQNYPITVGGGGAGSTCRAVTGTSGANSVFDTITSAGGGGGASDGSPGFGDGLPGGSGGGAGNSGTKGSGNTPPVSPAQGFDGGCSSSGYTGSGGGGATQAGTSAGAPGAIGNGGDGATTGISGSNTTYAGGGGGGGFQPEPGTPAGSGGAGGGGDGTSPGASTGGAGTANTGGGGGGNGGPTGTGAGGAGGSGIVIIRYKFQ